MFKSNLFLFKWLFYYYYFLHFKIFTMYPWIHIIFLSISVNCFLWWFIGEVLCSFSSEKYLVCNSVTVQFIPPTPKLHAWDMSIYIDLNSPLIYQEDISSWDFVYITKYSIYTKKCKLSLFWHPPAIKVILCFDLHLYI